MDKLNSNRRELTPGQRRLISALGLVAFLLLSAAVFYYIGLPMLRFASDPERFRALVNEHGIGGRLAYVGMVTLQITVALIPGEPLEIAAGYAFGTVEGTILCLAATGLGSCLVICLVRRFGTRLAEIFFTREKLSKLRFLQASPKRTAIFALIFMLPGTPKDLLCYYAGLTDIKLGTLLIICTLGRIPSVLTSTLGGDALGTKSYILAAVVFAMTLLISAGGFWLYSRICSKHQPPVTAEKGAAK